MDRRLAVPFIHVPLRHRLRVRFVDIARGEPEIVRWVGGAAIWVQELLLSLLLAALLLLFVPAYSRVVLRRERVLFGVVRCVSDVACEWRVGEVSPKREHNRRLKP